MLKKRSPWKKCLLPSRTGSRKKRSRPVYENAENERKKTEKAIEELETRDKEIDEELAKPEVATDPSKCIPLSSEKGEIAEKLEELYEKWEELANRQVSPIF